MMNLLGKYNEIWDKVSNTIKKRFDIESVYNEKYLRTKIKSFEGKIRTNLYGDGIPKEGSQCICLSITLIDSVFRICKNYYLQVFLEECECEVKWRINVFFKKGKSALAKYDSFITQTKEVQAKKKKKMMCTVFLKNYVYNALNYI